MKRILFAMGAVMSALVLQAEASDIKGKVPGKPGAEAVVWVEGIKKFQVPKTKAALSQRGTRFSPSLLVVVVGQTVDMPNDDNVAHNVFSYSSAKQFNLGIYPKGESRSVTFTQPGLIELFCSIHRQMSAKILVVPNTFYSRTRGGSEFRIAGVPPGKYVLKVWGEGIGQQSRMVTVPASGEARVDFTN